MKLFILKSRNKKVSQETGQAPYKFLRNSTGQATTELAIMGTIVLILLSYLLSQGYLYSQRLGLEMYTFRKALQISQEQQRGISLQVMRDVVVPSFFTGLNRQRLMASSVIDYNPWKLYIARDEDPEDTPTRQLMQINEGMIRNDYFFEVPPTRIKVIPKEKADDYEEEYQWVNSTISGLDDVDVSEVGGRPSTKTKGKTSEYSNLAYTAEASKTGKMLQKDLSSTENVNTIINFENQEELLKNYQETDWEEEIERDAATGKVKVYVDESSIPKNLEVNAEEEIRREKSVITPY